MRRKHTERKKQEIKLRRLGVRMAVLFGSAATQVKNPRTLTKYLASSAGLRNKLVREYDEINPKRLYHSLKTFTKQYHEYGCAILSYLKKQGGT